MRRDTVYSISGICMMVVFILSAYDDASTWVQVASCTSGMYYLHMAGYHSEENLL